MTEPSPQRPVPGPPRPAVQDGPAAPAPEAEAFGDLDQRPVAEHVAIFEAEHTRLRDELSTIDQL
jgi:hypothetical protein